MISISVNRLGDQLKINSDIQTEITDFYRMRNTLWFDCMLSDSINTGAHEFIVYRENAQITYRIEDDQLIRFSENGVQTEFKTPVELYENIEQEEGSELVLQFSWKSQPVVWRFLNKPNVATSINTYFEKLDE